MALRPVGGRECCGGPPGGKGWEKQEAGVGEPLSPGSLEKTTAAEHSGSTSSLLSAGGGMEAGGVGP